MAAVKAVGVKVNVYDPAVPVTIKLVNVATPEMALTVVVPESDPEPVRAVSYTHLTLPTICSV